MAIPPACSLPQQACKPEYPAKDSLFYVFPEVFCTFQCICMYTGLRCFRLLIVNIYNFKYK